MLIGAMPFKSLKLAKDPLRNRIGLPLDVEKIYIEMPVLTVACQNCQKLLQNWLNLSEVAWVLFWKVWLTSRNLWGP